MAKTKTKIEAPRSEILEAALRYARENNWTLFPVPPGTKRSYKAKEYSGGIPWGATRDLDEIDRDFQNLPEAGIGLPTGGPNGFWVLEVDTPEGHDVDGIASLNELIAIHGPLPETLQAISPSGSIHYYWKTPIGWNEPKIRNSVSKLGPDIDVRGDGGMVIAPPTVRPGKGAYRWLNDNEIAKAPKWLLELVTAEPERPPRVAEMTMNGEHSPVDLVQIRFALAAIDPDTDYRTWFEIGAVLFNTLGEAGLNIFDEWSAKGKKYPGAYEVAKKWDSFAGYNYSIGTLYHHASEVDPDWGEISQALLDNRTDEENAAEEAWLRETYWAMMPAAKKKAKAAEPPPDFSHYAAAFQNTINNEPPPPRAAAAAKAAPIGVNTILASEIVAREKRWLWKHHIMRGALELLTGVPGLGKSQVQCSFIACVTTGKDWPDGQKGCEPANVIMLSAEDAYDQDIIPRLLAAGADTKRVHILECIKVNPIYNRQFLLQEDLDELEREVKRIGNVALITIDPITAYMGGKMDSHKTTEVRSQLGPLKEFAERLDVAISAITHPAKNASQKAIDHFIGSQAFIAAARLGHVCVEEVQEVEDDGRVRKVPTGRVLFAHAKHNPTTKQPTYAFTIKGIIVDQDHYTGENIEAPHVVWDKTPIHINANDAVAEANSMTKKKDDGRQKDQGAVQAFLKAVLTAGPRPIKEIEELAYAEGMYTKRQLALAAHHLGVKPKKDGIAGGWIWSLPS